MYFNIRLCILLLGVVNVIESYVNNKCSNKTYCENVIPIFGDDDVQPIFTGTIFHSASNNEHIPHFHNRWKFVKKIFNNVSKKIVHPSQILESLNHRIRNRENENENKNNTDDVNIYERLLFST